MAIRLCRVVVANMLRMRCIKLFGNGLAGAVFFWEPAVTEISSMVNN